MRLRLASLFFSLLSLCLIPAVVGQEVVYTNGPINGSQPGYDFMGSIAVADSFFVSGAATITSFDAGVVVETGDMPTTVTWKILTGGPDWMGGTIVASGTASWSNVYWGSHFFYDFYTSTINGLDVFLVDGTYWLELTGGNTRIFREIPGWNVNFGPSVAYFSNGGPDPIPSEAFTIYGTPGPQCKGDPEIGHIDFKDAHGQSGAGIKDFYDGTTYHYELKSTDPNDPPYCTFDGYVQEIVNTNLESDCPFPPFYQHKSQLKVQHGLEQSNFVNWIQDVVATLRVDLRKSCHTEDYQKLTWYGTNRGPVVLVGQNNLEKQIDLKDNYTGTITTTSFNVSNSTYYLCDPHCF